jgi:Pla-1/cef family extracellular lipase
MKKLVIGLAIASALGLSACDSESVKDVQQQAVEQGPVAIDPARIVFDPKNGKLSVPNDLLFSGTTDGTLEMPDEVTAKAAGLTPDYSDPSIALGVLDGWSTINPFILGVNFPAGTSLDASSVNGDSVKIYAAIGGGDASDSDCVAVPRGAACKVTAALTFGVDYVATAKGNDIAVVPLKPLHAKTVYLVALTNQLQDDNGNAVAGSSTYETARQDINTAPGNGASLLALQGAINSYENAVVAAGLDRDSIIYTMSMTTQSIADTLLTVKTMLAANMSLNPAATPRVNVQYTGMNVAEIMVATGVLAPDNPSLPAFSAALFYQGNVTLPYYLGVPTATNPLAPMNTFWKAVCDSGVMVAGYAAQVGDSYPYDPATTAPVSANDGMCIALSGGKLRDFTNAETGFILDKERHLTKFNLIPKVNKMVDLDVQMTLPEINTVNFIRVNVLGLEAIDEPEAGWPVVIVQHGITSRKEDMLAATANLALAGFATVAIDLPLHSSRGFDIDPDSEGDEINASTVSPTHYINLGNLPATRDNSRQGVADLLGLRLGLNFIQGANIDSSRVYNLGLSLGAITSSNFLALANTRNLDAALGLPAGAPSVDDLFAVRAGVLASPGGGLANLLVESGAFGPLIKGSILSAAGTALSDEFNAFMAAPAVECLDYLGDQNSYLTCATTAFTGKLVLNAETAKLAEFGGLVAQFVFAAQTVTDASDPSNLAGMLAANGSAILVTEVIGDGIDNLSDQVIPNQTVNSPAGGTEPLIRALGLTDKAISHSTVGEIVDGMPAKISGVIRFTKGHHSSLINPAIRPEATDGAINGRVTQEMQSQVVSYFSADGRAVLVTDDALILGGD